MEKSSTVMGRRGMMMTVAGESVEWREQLMGAVGQIKQLLVGGARPSAGDW